MAIQAVTVNVNGVAYPAEYNTQTGLYRVIAPKPTGGEYGTVKAVDTAGNYATAAVRLVTYEGFKIDGVRFKNPTSFSIEPYTLTKSTRVATGDMVMDYVSNKLKFVFGWSAIDSDELDVLIDILWRQLDQTKECFHWLEFESPYNYKTGERGAVTHNKVRVYAGSIPHKLHRGHGSKWVWKDVSMNLIEK